jgi:competence protein ComGC
MVLMIRKFHQYDQSSKSMFRFFLKLLLIELIIIIIIIILLLLLLLDVVTAQIAAVATADRGIDYILDVAVI